MLAGERHRLYTASAKRKKAEAQVSLHERGAAAAH